MMRSRMFWRIFGAYGLLWLLAVGLLGLVLVARVRQVALTSIEDRLRARALFLAEAVRGRSADVAAWQALAERLDAETGSRITLIRADGEVLAESQRDPRRHHVENHGARPEVEQARTERFGVVRHRHSVTVGQEMMYCALRTDDPEGAAAFVRVALPLDAVEGEVAVLHGIIWSAAAVTALAGTALAFWLARRLVQPVRELTAAAEQLAAGDYSRRVYAMPGDELGTLARTFNHMSECLAAQFAQVEEDRHQLRTILGGMVEGVVALDREQRILFANERAGRLLGFSGGLASGRKLWEAVRSRALQDIVGRAMVSSEPVGAELDGVGAAAGSLMVHAARLPGVPTRGAVVVLHDTTELRRLERLRQEFVANVSHELKTPLSVIKACVETLLDGAIEDTEHRGRFLERIREQSDRLHALILDLLSLARIESGAEVFEPGPVLVKAAVEHCLERHRARAEASKQLLEADEEDGRANEAGEVAAWADEEAIALILDNLVDNALKYTPEGGRIRVSWATDDGTVRLEVSDTGIGIPERDLPRVFERFYRVDKARSRELGGTGLGLSIVKHLAQAMQGSVEARSRPGEGSRFVVRLPRAGT